MDEADRRRASASHRCRRAGRLDAAADARDWRPCWASCSGPASAAASGSTSTPTAKNSDRYLVHLARAASGCPTSRTTATTQFAEIRAAYAAPHRRDVRARARRHDPARRRRAGASSRWRPSSPPATGTRSSAATPIDLQPADVADLPARAPGFDWDAWVTALGGAGQTPAGLVVRQPDYLTAFAALLAERAARGLAATGCAGASIRAARAVPARPTTWSSRELRLLRPHPSAAPSSCASAGSAASALVEGSLGEAVGKLYVARHFPPRPRR